MLGQQGRPESDKIWRGEREADRNRRDREFSSARAEEKQTSAHDYTKDGAVGLGDGRAAVTGGPPRVSKRATPIMGAARGAGFW